MKARPALVVSAILTAFTLVTIGALIGRVTSINPASEAATADVIPTIGQAPVPSPDEPRTDPSPVDSSAIAVPSEQPTTGSTPIQPAGDPSPARPISAEQAVQVAQAYLGGGGSLERVELEEEHGNLVYEVRFSNKNRVYVDAYSGVVVYARIENDDDD